jgi:hypothetical protein
MPQVGCCNGWFDRLTATSSSFELPMSTPIVDTGYGSRPSWDVNDHDRRAFFEFRGFAKMGAHVVEGITVQRRQADVVHENRLPLLRFVHEDLKTHDFAEPRTDRVFVRLAERGEPIIGMISLETLGSFSDQPGSQSYPPPLGLLYPSKGDFIAFVAMPGSRDLMQALIGSFRSHTKFPTVGGVAPGFVPGIDWSDHWSFEQFRYPAVMITDTAYFRYPHYHKATDTPDKVDIERLARITHGIERVVREMIRPEWPTAAAKPRPF